MTVNFRTGIVLFAALLAGAPRAVVDRDPRDLLQSGEIESMSIHLEAAGANLGFEAVIDGTDPRLASLIQVIRDARTRGGHRCSNAGSIRFRLTGGGVVGVGLLPSHNPGVYELRIYDGERLVDAYRVERAALLNALTLLGIPTDHRAFRE
jgi:hypothetical protein